MSSLRSFSLDRQVFNPSLYARLLNLWLGDVPQGATAPPKDAVLRWFGGGGEAARTAFDNECKSGFRSALESIGPSKFSLPEFRDVDADRKNSAKIASPFLSQFQSEDGSEQPQVALALILLLDQIPRNIFRDDQAAIYGHYDRISRAVFHEVHARKLDQHERYRLSPPWRVWFYMPLMHSESLADHELFNQIVGELKVKLEENGDQAGVDYLKMTMDFQRKHDIILEEFGRYPHRNEMLGRKSTAEEVRWLGTNGDMFNTK